MPGIEDALADAGATPEWMEVEQFFGKKDRHYAKTYLEEQAKYEKFHEDTRQGIQSCNVQRAACARLDDHLSLLLTEVDTDIRGKVRQQRQERHTMETRLEKVCEEKIVDVRGLMVEETKSRSTGDVYTQEVTNEVCHLYNDLESAKNYRLQKSERLQEVVTSKLDEIQVALEAESKIREESTHTVLELFGQMGTKMQQEIDKTKAERKESTDRLIQLMEVVLPHLEQARLNQVKLVNEKLEDQKAAAKLASEVADKCQKRKSMHAAARSSQVGDLPPPAPPPPAPDEAPLSSAQMSIEALKKLLPVIQAAAAFQSSAAPLAPQN